MSTSVMTGLLNKATNGNELLSILDAIVYNNSDAEIVEHDTAISDYSYSGTTAVLIT